MNINTDTNRLSFAAPSMSVLTDRQETFSGVLARARGGTDKRKAIRDAAEDFVSVAFIQPVLKQLREGNQAAAPFAPGPAEKQFGGLMDSAMSRQIVKASNFGLVDRIAADLAKRAGLEKPGAAPVTSVNGSAA